MGNLHYTSLLFHSLLEYGSWFSLAICLILLVYSKPTHEIGSQRQTDLHIYQIESLEDPTPIPDYMYMITSDWQWTWVPDLSPAEVLALGLFPSLLLLSIYCTECMCNGGGTVSIINDESHFIWELSACEKVEISSVGQNRSGLKHRNTACWWLLKWQTKCVHSSAKENAYWSLLIKSRYRSGYNK